MTAVSIGRLDFVLLGIRVAVRGDADILERLSGWYGPALVGSGATSDVEASIARRADVTTFDVAVDGTSRTEDDDIAAVRALHHETLHAVMRRRPDLLFVHAGVVDVGGCGIVLPGLSRAGKSTLVLALLQRGAGLLSDELLAYDPSARVALAVPRAVKLRDVVQGHFPAIAPRCIGTGEGRFVPFDVLGSPGIVARTVPRVIVLPRYLEGGDDTPAPLTTGQAFLGVVASTLNFGVRRQGSVDVLGDFVGSTRAWRLEWCDPHRAAAAILATLDGLPS